MTAPTNSISLSVSSLKSYLNRALIFINKAKATANPFYACIYLEEDKCYTNNGEAGTIISFPLTVSQPTLFFPFELAMVVNNNKDDSEIKLEFDYEKMICKVTSQNVDIRVKLLDPTAFQIPEIPDDLEFFEIENFMDKTRRAMVATHSDVSMMLLQGVRVTNSSFCSCDQRIVWREESSNPKEFVVPKLLAEYLVKIGVEPTQIGLNANQIHLIFQDMIVFSARIVEDDKYPDVNGVFDKLHKMGSLALVQYDRESLTSKLESLLMLAAEDNAIRLECKSNNLIAHKQVQKADDTEAKIAMMVNSTADFENVIINGELFKEGVSRFIQFSILDDNKRILFSKEGQDFCLCRRDVR